MAELDALRNSDLFADVGKDDVETLTGALTILHLSPGEILHNSGDLYRGGFLLIQGTVRETHAGGESTDFVEPGSLIGPAGLLDDHLAESTAVVTEHEAIAAQLQRKDFERLLEGSNRAAQAILDEVARRLVEDLRLLNQTLNDLVAAA